jgi:DNA-binding transcriptional LysR family regulator
MNDKLAALKTGMGIGTLPICYAQSALDSGELEVIGDDPIYELDMVLAWNRNQMGKAKVWCIKNIEKLWKKQLN